MAKKLTLKKSPTFAPMIKEAKTVEYETVGGNKGILKATVIGVAKESIKKSQSNSLTDDDDSVIGYDSGIIRPPLSQQELSVLQEYSSELGPNIDAMVIGIEGFGQRIIKRSMIKAQEEQHQAAILGEEVYIQSNIIDYPNADESLRQLRKILCKDREQTGNAYLELVPGLTAGKYSAYIRLAPGNMYICKADKTFTRVTAKYVNKNLEVKERYFLKKLRKFVQIEGKKKVFYKEFRDHRPMHALTGEILRVRNMNGKPTIVDSKGNEVKANMLAHEIYHFKIPTTRRTPYGLPRYTGNIIAIKGSRSADESNILTLQNNNVPSMAILVSGGMLTSGSVDRIQEFVDTAIKGDLNYSKFLILEGESSSDGLSGPSSMKVEIKPLTNDQHTDALWSEYNKENSTKIRKAFRQSPILVGDVTNLDRATAVESERLAEKYVYNPEREDLDEAWNKILSQQGIRFHLIETNSPNITNSDDIVKILSGAEKTGGVTPRIAHEMLEEILNRKLPALVENDPDFSPDLPFSISVGKLARGMARSNGAGTLATTGQEEADRSQEDLQTKFLDKARKSVTSEKGLDFIQSLHDAVQAIYEVDTMGETIEKTRKAHKHEH